MHAMTAASTPGSVQEHSCSLAAVTARPMHGLLNRKSSSAAATPQAVGASTVSPAVATVGTPPLTTPERLRAPFDNNALASLDAEAIFVCDEESHFYSQCLERLLLRSCAGHETVIEFGSGEGSPVLNALTKAPFRGKIHGFELNSTSAALARSNAAASGLSHKYHVHNSCFFEGVRQLKASTLIANPPYIPAPDDDILMPALHGGPDGANLTRELMTLGFDNAVLLLSAYCDPVRTMRFAQSQGYRCTDFMVTPLPFGVYSSEPKVRDWIAKMKADGCAFYSGNTYLLAGALLQKVVSFSQGPQRNHISTASTPVSGAANNILPAAEMSSRPAGPVSVAPSSQSSEDLTDELLAILTAFR